MDKFYGKIIALKVNQTGTSKNTSKWMTASMCVCISVLIHLVLAMMISLRIIMLKTEPIEDKNEVIPSEDMVIQIQLAPNPTEPKPLIIPPKNAPLTPAELKALAAQTLPPEKPDEKSQPTPKANEVPRFARTTDDQLSGDVPDTILQGARDTIAASNANPLKSAGDRPSVSGQKPKDGEEETVDTTYQDGVLEHMNRRGETVKTEQKPPVEEEQDPAKLADIDQEEKKSSVKSTEEPGEELEAGEIAKTNKEANQFLKTQKKMALNDNLPSSNNKGAKQKAGQEEQNKTIANNDSQPDPNALKQKSQNEKQKKKEAQPESQPKTAENKKASENSEKGFRSEAKATVMEGTISRRSKIASQNVKSTPVGKYMAQISKIVEQEWQRRCMMHADLIQPGTLRISFMIDEQGKLSNITTLSQTFGSENQRGWTFQALTSVKIPPMPQEVKVNQGGDPIEFRYNFRFQ
jgi:hypothetical protein